MVYLLKKSTLQSHSRVLTNHNWSDIIQKNLFNDKLCLVHWYYHRYHPPVPSTVAVRNRFSGIQNTFANSFIYQNRNVPYSWNSFWWKTTSRFSTKLISWLLMSWRWNEPAHYQLWHWYNFPGMYRFRTRLVQTHNIWCAKISEKRGRLLWNFFEAKLIKYSY